MLSSSELWPLPGGPPQLSQEGSSWTTFPSSDCVVDLRDAFNWEGGSGNKVTGSPEKTRKPDAHPLECQQPVDQAIPLPDITSLGSLSGCCFTSSHPRDERCVVIWKEVRGWYHGPRSQPHLPPGQVEELVCTWEVSREGWHRMVISRALPRG